MPKPMPISESSTDTSAMTPKGALQKRSMRIAGHRTSLALEKEFWDGLEKIARAHSQSLPMLIASIDETRAKGAPDASLASAVRVFVLQNRV